MFLQTKSIFKYTILGLILALTAFKILGDRITREELIMLGLAAAFASAILDIFVPTYYVEYEAKRTTTTMG